MYNNSSQFTNIYILDCSKLHGVFDSGIAYELLDKKRKMKVDQCNLQKDKYLSMGTGLLCRILYSKYDILPIIYDESGKPHIEGNRYYVSISHSEKYACIGISTEPLGIDIEYQDEDYLYIANRYYTEDEKKNIQSSANKIKEFYDIWCKKECMIKRDGFMEPTTFSTNIPMEDCIFYSIPLPEYSFICYCTRNIPINVYDITTQIFQQISCSSSDLMLERCYIKDA